MIKVNASGTTLSTAYYNKINSFSRHFQLKLTDISNNTDLDLTYKSATFHRGSCGGSSFAIGCAYSAYLEVTARYDSMLLEGKKVLATIGVLMDADNDTYEWVKIGIFQIQKPVREKDMMTFTAVDAMLYAITGDYTSLLTYPATISDIVDEIEQTYNVDITLKAAIGSCALDTPIAIGNVRGVIQTLAALSLGYAYVNSEGEIIIDYFNRAGDVVDLDFDLVKTQPVMDERATLIDGVKVQASTESSEVPQIMFEYPTSNVTHAITVGCPYMTQEIFDIVKLNFVGFTYNGGTVNFMGNPLIEPCDMLRFTGNSDEILYNVVTDADEDIVTNDSFIIGAEDYVTFNMACMEVNYDFDGGLTTTVTAPGSFEVTEETTQPGVLSQLAALESSSGKTVTQIISGTRHEAHDAKQVADNTNQYFWHTTVDDGSGVGTGTHITEIPQADFIRDPENGGGNLLMRSNGIAVRNGLFEVAQFTSEFIRLCNSQAIPIFEAAQSGSESTLVYDIAWDVPANSTVELTLNRPLGQGESITLVTGRLGMETLTGDVADTGTINNSTYSYDGKRTITVEATESYTFIAAMCQPDVDVPYFTLGTRDGEPGAFSAAIGEGLIASGDRQTVIGKFNKEDSDQALIIGGGSGAFSALTPELLNRKNIFAVDWDGNVDCTNMQCGYAMVTGGANVVRTKSVTFAKPFTTDPHVVATPYVQYPQNAQVSLSSITRTGFDINLYYASTTDVNVQWIAIAGA